MLGLCCCTRAFSSCNEQGLLSSCVACLLILVTSRGAQALGHTGFSSFNSWALEHRLGRPVAHGILTLRPRTEPMSPALAGELLTTGPPGKSL